MSKMNKNFTQTPNLKYNFFKWSLPLFFIRMTLTVLITDFCLCCRLGTFYRVEPPACCMYHNRFMWSFLLRCCSATFGLVTKINNKNDQESTICNVCDAEIHRRVWGWVDSLLPDSRLINCGAENNSWIKRIWWMALSGVRGSWGYALWHYYCNYVSWPWRRFGNVYDVDIQQLIDIHWNGCCWFSSRFIYPGKVWWGWTLFFSTNTLS